MTRYTRIGVIIGTLILGAPALSLGQHVEDELRGIRRALEQQAYEARQREYAEQQRLSLDQLNAGLAGLFLALEHRQAQKAATPPSPTPQRPRTYAIGDEVDPADLLEEVPAPAAKEAKPKSCPFWRRSCW